MSTISSSNSAGSNPFKSLDHATTYFKKHYPKLLQLSSCKEYVEYYEQRELEVDRIIGSGRLTKDCILWIIKKNAYNIGL